MSHKKFIFFAIMFFAMFHCLAMVKKEQLIFTNIILEPILFSAQENGIQFSGLHEIVSGKVSSGFKTKIYLQKLDTPSHSNPEIVTFKISIEKINKFFIVQAKNKIITEITEFDGDNRRLFYRPHSILNLNTGNENHRFFSQNLIQQAFQTVDIFPVLLNEGLESIDITVLSVREEQDSWIAYYKLNDDKKIMLLTFTKGVIEGNNCFQITTKGYSELWGIHTQKQGFSYYMRDFYTMDTEKNGLYCEFFSSGLVRNFVDSKAGTWGKQKVWNSDGKLEGEYVYPPGKTDMQSPIKDLFPDWCTYIEGAKSIRYDKGEYWDGETKSPRYSALLNTFQYGKYGIIFYFSRDKNILNRKYEKMIEQKKKLYTPQPSFTFAENTKNFTFVDNMYVLKENGNYRELLLKKDNMIIILETQNNSSEDVDKIIANIIHAYDRFTKQ